MRIANPSPGAGNATEMVHSGQSVDGLSPACHAMPGGWINLAAALRALADAGLPPDALTAAVEALLRAASGVGPPATAPPQRWDA